MDTDITLDSSMTPLEEASQPEESALEVKSRMNNIQRENKGSFSESIPEFDITIKYISPDGCIDGTQSIIIRVKRTDLIATVKAKYVDTEKCPSPNYILFKYGDKELLDQNTLRDYGIVHDCVIYHEYINRVPYSAVDYHTLSKLIEEEAIKNKDFTKAGFDPEYGRWDQEWTKGDEWKDYPNVIRPNIWDDNRREALIVGNHRSSFHIKEFPDRLFKTIYVTQVKDYLFQCIHKMEGKWNGDILQLNEYGTSDSLVVSEVELNFDPQGFWIEARKQVTPMGLVTVATYKYIPTGNGKLRLANVEGGTQGLNIEVTEMSPMLLVTTAISKYTNKPVYIETVTMIDPMSRVRTIQHFSESGAFTGVDLMNEKRVLDQTSGALAQFKMPPQKPEQI
ncbi:hypothetical protein WA158_006085 [Blastocystis sp. Blastoise]